MIARLVLRGEPAADESLVGFVSRISTANGLGHCKPLLDRCGLKLRDFDRTDTDLAVLAHLTGASITQLEARSFRPRPDHPRFCSLAGSPVPYNLLMWSHRRVCRACLEEKGYAPALWHLKTYCACHVHGRLLVDRCGQCSQTYRWDRSTLDACRCGAEFGDGAQASASVLDMCMKTARARDGDDQSLLGGCGPGGLSAFLWYFGGAGGTRGQIPNSNTEWWAGVVEAGARMLDGWPTSFQTWVVDGCCQDPNNMVLTSELRGTLDSVRHHFSELLPTVSDSLRTTLLEHWPGAIFCTGTFWKNAPRFKYMTLAEAGRVLGVCAATLLELSAAGRLKIRYRAAGKRFYRAVDADDVRRIAAEHLALLSPAAAAAVLGVSEFHLRSLRRAGLLDAALTVSSIPRYNADALREFAARLSSCSVRDTTSYRCCVTDRMISLVDIVRLILTGELQAVWGPLPDRSLSNLFISAADARRFSGTHWQTWSDPQLVSPGFASVTLGLPMPAIRELVKRGFLKGPSEAQDGKLHGVTRESFEEFDRTFISSKRIGMAHSLSAAAVSRRIAAQGILPIVPSMPALKTPGIWRREDLSLIDLYGPERSPPSMRSPNSLARGFCTMGIVSRELSIDRESLTRLRSAGFFGSCEPGQRGIHVQDLEGFRKRYVSSSELGHRHALAPHRVTRVLLGLGLSPIYKRMRNERVQSCWVRAEVDHLNLPDLCLGDRRITTPKPSWRVRSVTPPSLGGEAPLCTEEISFADAVEQLGTTSATALMVTKMGYLVIARRNTYGRIVSFDAASVRQLAADYVFNRQLASELNISPQAVYLRMRPRGLTPVIPPHHMTEGLWRRADVEQLGDVLALL